ncbi:MAG TPA: DHA2 family efflux MFS transporter permease subunit [Sphingobium sp.]
MNSAAAEQAPLRGGALALTAFALALGTFMQVLDTTIANVSLPTIAGNLGVSSDSGTWVVTSFAVANGVTVPLTGWLMGRFGVVRTFCASVLLFTLASLLCGLAWNLSSLILFRIFQGAVSGPMIPGSQALLLAIFPPAKRATALGVWSITTLVAPILGPILGGYISDNFHWSWIFLINLPVGLFCAAVCWRSLATRETPTRKLPIDGIGVALLIIWVGAMQIVLDLGKNADWFSSGFIVAMAVVAVIICIAWVIWELTDAHPVVDLRMFRNRNFALGTLALCLGYAVYFANVLIMPLWLQTQMGYTATWAGLVAAPSGVAAVLLTPIMARISGKVDARLMGSFSFLAFGYSYFLRTDYTTSVTLWDLVMPLLVNGVGTSCFFLALISIQLEGVRPDQIPSATGLSNFARITSGSFAASIITTSWDQREALHQSRLADHLSASAPAYEAALRTLGGRGASDIQAAATIARQMVQQAYLLAINDLFWISGWIFFLLICPLWLTRRPKGSAGPVAAD